MRRSLFDCTLGLPEHLRPSATGSRPVSWPPMGGGWTAGAAEPASVVEPEGIYGPAFLATKNYFVIKEYNFSDLYVFVGHVADRITDPRRFETPWSEAAPCAPPT